MSVVRATDTVLLTDADEGGPRQYAGLATGGRAACGAVEAGVLCRCEVAVNVNIDGRRLAEGRIEAAQRVAKGGGSEGARDA